MAQCHVAYEIVRIGCTHQQYQGKVFSNSHLHNLVLECKGKGILLVVLSKSTGEGLAKMIPEVVERTYV